MENQKAYERASKKVEVKLGFYRHLSTYAVVMVFLLVVNLMTSSDNLWVKWPALGWGIFVVFHGLNVFFAVKTAGIRERMIEKEMEKELARKGGPE